MKKVLSLMLALCLVASFMAMNVSAAPAYQLVAEVEPTATGANVALKIVGDITLSGWEIYLKYDQFANTGGAQSVNFVSATRPTDDASNPYYGLFDANWTKQGSIAETKKKVTIGSGAYASYKGSTYCYVKLNNETIVADSYVTVSSEKGALELANIVFAGENLTADNFSFDAIVTSSNASTNTVKGSSLKANAVALFNTKDGATEYAAITTKSTGGSDDVVATTFNTVYTDGTTVCVFGKAATGASEAGIYVTKDGAALEHSTAMAKTNKGAGFFPAYKSDITAAFGVQIQELEAGAYTAAVYSDDTTTTAVSFSIAG